ncbi:MAG: L,D-transpeptidase [Candidatus Cloacimonetes bacterium]|nr:L,D-transpeptidase [Candidatus Cloacimonadota bacterium]
MLGIPQNTSWKNQWRNTLLVVCFLTLSLNASLTAEPVDLDYLINYTIPLAELFDSIAVDHDCLTFLIDKSDYTLSLIIDTLTVKQYPVVFGSNPWDDKLQQGDQCTPEGIFHMQAKYPHRWWLKFIWLDYPNHESWRKYHAAVQTGLIPANAYIGGEIGIHGVPENCDYLVLERINWTLGCISLTNADIAEIYNFFTESSVIIIQK